MDTEPLAGELLPAVPAAPAAGVVLVDDDDAPPPPASVEQLVRDWLIEYPSPNSRAAYRRDIGLWLGFCDASGLDPLGPPERKHLAAWLAVLADVRGERPATRARRLAAVSAWYDWLRTQRRVRRNPAAELKPELRPQWPRTSSLPSLTREQATALLAAADSYTGAAGHRRAAAIVALLIYGGLRVSELTAATVDQLGETRGHRALCGIVGKGDRTRDVVLPAPAARRVDAYLAERTDLASDRLPARPGEQAPCRPLIATATGRPLDRGAVWRLLRSLARRGGITVKMSPHVLRATYVTLARDAGARLEDIQEGAGHASIATTRRYDRAATRLDRSPGYTLAAYIDAERA